MGVTGTEPAEVEGLIKLVDRLGEVMRARGLAYLEIEDLKITLGPDPGIAAALASSREEVEAALRAQGANGVVSPNGDPLRDPYTFMGRGVPSFREYPEPERDQ